MRRTALSAFFERVIVASLPIAISACGGAKTGGGGVGGGGMMSQPDMAVVDTAGDMAGGTTGADMLPDTLDLLPPSDLDSCEIMHPVTAVNMPASDLPDGGFPTLCENGSPCTDVCPTGYGQCCHPTPSDGGAYLVQCVYNCGPSGRRPAGLEEAHAADGCAVGRYFASMAHLEAASVHAFRTMARELVAHGAPSRLVAAARRAARDEIRHARLTRQMAARHGGTPAPVRVAATAPRSLEAMATENAVEGCVRETFGALLASWQARAAGDERVRAMMTEIAVDEARHAELAWALDAWSRRVLDREARRRVREARRAAAEALAAEMQLAPPAELVDRVGLPDVARANQWVAAVRRELWS